jgi:hypothetical protein
MRLDELLDRVDSTTGADWVRIENDPELLHTAVLRGDVAINLKWDREHDTGGRWTEKWAEEFSDSSAFIGAVAVPERRIPTFAVTDPLGATLAAVTILALTFGLIWLAHGVDRHFPSPSERGTDRPRTTETPATTSGTVGAVPATPAADA